MLENKTQPDKRVGMVAEIAFAASALLVIASIPVSAAVGVPDLPGLTLILTGVAAALIALRQSPSRSAKLLSGLTGLMLMFVIAHQILHRYGIGHNWLDPLYIGVIIIYCLISLAAAALSLFKASRLA